MSLQDLDHLCNKGLDINDFFIDNSKILNNNTL